MTSHPYNHAQFVANLFSLSQTQRRLHHRARREAIHYFLTGDAFKYQLAAREADRLWREAKFHFRKFREHARRLAA